jgi:hypothetical protein
MITKSKNLKVVLEILKNEVDGNAKAALTKMTSDYSMTWMYKKGRKFFPTTTNTMEEDLEEVYPIKGRQYDIRNIAEGKDLLMLEMIESYPDPDTGEVYRTPQIIVLEMKGGKIKTGRHYCDPKTSFGNLSIDEINSALKNAKTKKIIK